MLATSDWITRQLVFDGVVSGLVTGLLAMGIVLVYRATRVINFAVGNIGLVGATLLSVMVVKYHAPFWVSVATALVVGTAFALIVEVAIIRRLFSSPRVIVLVATIGIGQLALAVASALPSLGSSGAGYPVVSRGTWGGIPGLQITGAQVSIIVCVPLVAAGLTWFLHRTAVGKSIAAAADNPALARLSGISPKTVSTIVWTLAGLLGALSLVLVAGEGLQASTLSQLGPDTLAMALIAAVLAGLESFSRAMLAGVAVGLLQALIGFNFIEQPGMVDLLLFLAVLAAVWFQSRKRVSEPRVHPTTPKSRPVPDYLRGVWWLRHVDKAGVGLALVVAVALPLVVTEPSKNLLYATILAYAICAASLTVLTGWSGVLSLGQMAFAGLGALTAASLTLGMHVHWTIGGVRLVDLSLHPIPFWAAIAVATALMALLAAGIGAGALRMSGTLLAVITFVFALTAQNFLYQLPLFGSSQTGTVTFVRGRLFGVDFSSQRAFYYAVLVVLAAVLLLLWRIRRTGSGRAQLGVRDNPDVAASYGVSSVRSRITAFALAGAIAGLGGALLAGVVESVPFNQEFFLANDSLVLVSIVVIGGLGSISGGVIGALWVIGLPAFFPNDDLVSLLTSSIGLLVMLLYFPGGFAQIGSSLKGALISLAERRFGPPPKKGVTTTPAFVRAREPEPALVAGSPALRTLDVSVAYGGNVAVADVSIEVRREEVVGLIGANGAGKTTLMNAIGGYLPSRGRVELLGRDVTRQAAPRRASAGLGRTFQGALLFPELTVRETVQLACEHRHPAGLVANALCAPRALRRERAKRVEAAELIDFLGLGRYGDHFVSELSTGTRRIVELAGVVGLGARVLCLDEPTSGVAQREAEAFGPLILQLRQELGASLLVIEHDMSLLMGISDRVYCLEAGALLASGRPDDVRRDRRVIASYLGTDGPGRDGVARTRARAAT